ncbi:ATP-binding cassette domain-containing protein [Alkalibaculum sp. M08DMB]|uniref:ATP-binding cassette domain-containing protein n=1 Tax=Alkalibaculum sporogenes TaxID=2655001 RepID=A0A6A7KCP7_9FIRM|nr:ABC transporter ATP-binding protein [Alkalibaculum sporogenes]MPW27125.1 ATP-binding cassette domain-containing protein [Alkalibaculum sporogenes]
MIKKLAPYISKYKKQFNLGCICTGLEAVFELLIPLVMAYIVDIGIRNRDIEYTIKMGLLMFLLSLIALGLGLASARLSSIAGQGFGAELREAEFNKIQTYSFKNIEKFSTASLITRLTGDVHTMQMSVTMGMRMLIRAPIMLVCALTLSFYLNAELAIVFAVAIPILAFSLFLIIRKVRPYFTDLQEKTDGLNITVQENLIGIRVVKSFVRGIFEKKKFNKSNEEMMQASERAFGLVVLNMPVMQMIMFSTIIAILWFGGNMVFSGNLLVGRLISFLAYVNQILFSLMMISMMFMMATRSVACAKRILEVLEEIPDIEDDNNNYDYEVKNGDVKFTNVTFRYYEDSSENNLTDINLDIESGQTIGIIGGTGSGKTTLAQLIPRLYDVTRGSVEVGGYDVRSYKLETLRNAVAMVLQNNTLFSGTIRENLKWGNAHASDKQIEAASKIACADEFINRFPDKYDTMLEQGGVNLSGGQRQRLTIARAILKQPKVLILDDSTSAVDTSTDAKIRQSFKRELKDTTKIIIAQRISSVYDADQIIVLDDGKISDIGNHSQLIKKNEIYQDVYKSQQEGVGFSG